MLSDEMVQRALREIRKGDAQRIYFFDHCNSYSWLAPLRQAGYFRQPPAPKRDEQYISFPFWEQSRYLARMAKVPDARQTVMEIALEIPDTENVRVHEDLLDIALALPPEMGARLVLQAKKWIQSPYKLLLREKLGDLIVYLSHGEQVDAALDLAGSTLALQPDPKAAEKEEEEFLSPEPQPLFDKWDYHQILVKAVPALAQARGIGTVRLLADLLENAIEFSIKQKEARPGDQDHLYIWHQAIEQDEDLLHVPSMLISAIRDAAEQTIRGDPAEFRVVVDDLGARQWVTFRRLVLHLCRVFDEAGLEEAERQLQDLDVLTDHNTRHEAVLLLKKVFPRLREPIRILDWIEREPDREGVRTWLGDKATDKDIDDECARWQRDWLAVLEDGLPEAWAERLAALVARLGPPRSLETVPRSTTWIGPTSPRSADSLTKMEPYEVIEFLKTWQPPGGPTDPTPEGLGRTLAGVVAVQSAAYAELATGFHDVDPTYVRSLFHGLREALREKATFDWNPVLELASWVMNQPREIPGRPANLMDSDPGWAWTRRAIADLLEEGFGNVAGAPPLAERERVWSILRPITEDPDPTPEHEEEYGGKNMDPAMMSINTVRGHAFHAVMQYALWVRRSSDSGAANHGGLPRSFDVMPEVREVLDRHLDLHYEPSLTIRSVYGRWLPSLAHLDWDWTGANLTQIFPTNDAERSYFQAAWESYVVFNRPNAGLLPILRPYYQHAVRQLDLVENQMEHPARSDNRLGEHLVVYYWWDKLQIDGEDGLIREFFARGASRAREHLMWFVGSSIADWDETVPTSVYERLRALFDYRLKAGQSAPTVAPFAGELAEFGFWFVSSKFEERWSLATLLSVLELAGRIEFERDVAKRLLKLCPRFPTECITALRRMTEGSKEPWIILALGDEAKTLLRTALRSGDPDAAFAARRFAEDMIEKGHFDFRNVLR